jgi:hypothetical protein
MLQVLGITLAIYTFLWFMGWGFSSLLLPQSLKSHQLWLAPWLGILVVNVSSVWLSWLGLGTQTSIYLVCFLGICLFALAWHFQKIDRVIWHKIDSYIFLALIITLLLILAPLIFSIHFPTTFTLLGADSQNAAVLGDYFQQHALSQIPPITYARLPDSSSIANTNLVNALSLVRPGTWLIYSTLSSLLHSQTHQVFTIALAIFQSLYTVLIGILTWVTTKRLFTVLVALALSSLNVNLMFFPYQGFGAQIPAQGIILLSFLLLHELHGSRKKSIFLIAMASSSLLTIYPEITPFFFLPMLSFIGFKLIYRKDRLTWLVNIIAIILCCILIDPRGASNGFFYLSLVSDQQAGWPMPRWASTIDMIGLTSIHAKMSEATIDTLNALSFPATILIGIGLLRFKNRQIGISLLLFTPLVLIYLRFFKHYSYGYYKAVGFLSFSLIIGFALGVDWTITQICLNRQRMRFAQTISMVGILILSVISIQESVKGGFKDFSYVDKATSDIALIPENSISNKTIFINEGAILKQMWIAKFLGHRHIIFTSQSPYYDDVWIRDYIPPNSLLLDSNNPELIHYVESSPSEILWQNDRYRLRTLAARDMGVQTDQNVACIPPPAQPFCWLNQDATFLVNYYGKHNATIKLDFRFSPIQPITTIDIFLNEKLIQTHQLKINPQQTQQVISVQIAPKSGPNKLRLNFREGAIPGPNRPSPTAIVMHEVQVERVFPPSPNTFDSP